MRKIHAFANSTLQTNYSRQSGVEVNVRGTYFLFFYFVQRAERAHVTMCLKSRIFDLPEKDSFRRPKRAGRGTGPENPKSFFDPRLTP
jgi:hypothetical protein